jgi:GGDEF domain-containing protein
VTKERNPVRRLKLSLITLLLFLSVMFNLERLEYRAGIDGVGINTFLYGLVTGAVVFMFIIPRIQRFSIFAFLFGWASAFFFLKLTFFYSAPIFGGYETYVTITELTILLIAIALAYQTAADLGDFQKFIEDVYLPNLGKRILKQETATEEIKTEFIRSRRNQLPLSLLVIRPTDTAKKAVTEVKKVVLEIQSHMTGRFISASLAKVIIDEARRTDLIISRGEEGPFFVLCLDTKMKDSTKLAERIQATAAENLGIAVSYGVASFPDEALTYEELVHRAELHLQTKEEAPAEVLEANSFLQDNQPKIQP